MHKKIVYIVINITFMFPGFGTVAIDENLDKNVEINILGSLYILKNRLHGFTSGICATVENIGTESNNITAGYTINTTSTHSINFEYRDEENITFSPDYFGTLTAANLGWEVGFIHMTAYVEEIGIDKDFYSKASGSGICIGPYAFVLTNQ